MKKIALVAAIVLVGGSLFAQNLAMPGNSRGPGMMGPGRGPAIEWKIGTVVTSEYKSVTGPVALSTNTVPTIKVDGTDYQLFGPLRSLTNLKTGDTGTIEGVVTTVKSETKVPPSIQVFKITINGQTTDFSQMRGGRGGDDEGPGVVEYRHRAVVVVIERGHGGERQETSRQIIKHRASSGAYCARDGDCSRIV